MHSAQWSAIVTAGIAGNTGSMTTRNWMPLLDNRIPHLDHGPPARGNHDASLRLLFDFHAAARSEIALYMMLRQVVSMMDWPFCTELFVTPKNQNFDQLR